MVYVAVILPHKCIICVFICTRVLTCTYILTRSLMEVILKLTVRVVSH